MSEQDWAVGMGNERTVGLSHLVLIDSKRSEELEVLL